MGVKQWATGDVLTAADLDAWAVPLAAVKSADQAITSNATYFNDADLVVSVAANATYVFRAYLIWECAATSAAGIKFQFTLPAGATLDAAPIGGISTGFYGDNGAGVSLVNMQATVANTKFGINLTGIAVIGATAGSLQLQWAQATSSTSATTLHLNSHLIAQRIG